MCENCINKAVCKYKETAENIEKTIDSLEDKSPISVNIECKYRRG